ncbi:glutamate dehydrogenase, partial [Streptomyces sp. NPDC059176]
MTAPSAGLDALYADILRRNPGEPEFHQAVREVLETLAPVIGLRPEFREAKVVERLAEPERQVIFRVPWQDDRGEVHV